MNFGLENPVDSHSKIILYNSPYGKVACVGPEHLGFYYAVTSVNNIQGLEDVQRILLPTHFRNKCSNEQEIYFLNEKISWINTIRNGIDKHVENIYKIGAHLGWQPTGNGLDCFLKFKTWMINHYYTDHTTLDFSDLGIDLLPLHIGLFSELENLDLSNNNIRFLPVELQSLKNLKYIDLRNNPIVDLPTWLKKMTHIEVKTDIVPEEREDWAQGRINPVG